MLSLTRSTSLVAAHRTVAMELLPYKARPGQDKIMAATAAAASAGRHLLLEAPTGIGKTAAAFAALRQEQLVAGRRIIWATRTNSQQRQILQEHKAMLDAGHDAGLVVPLMGRRQYCPLLRADPEFKAGTPEELGLTCRNAKRKATESIESGRGVKGACKYYKGLLRDGTGPVEALLRAGVEDGTQLAQAIEAAGSCPYEALKAILPQADVVVAPYIFLIDDQLRNMLMQWMGASPDECIVLFDEAHNLPDQVRQHNTPSLTQYTLARAQKEALDQQDPVLGGTMLASSILAGLTRILSDLGEETVHNGDDGLVPPGVFEESVLRELRIPTPRLRGLAHELITWGQAIRDEKQAKGKLPRSYMGAVGSFLLEWISQLDGDRVSILTLEPLSLERYLLHPAPAMRWLQECWSTIHMSGTLSPMTEYATLCGLDAHSAVQIEEGRPGQRLQIRYVEGVHRRWAQHQEDPEIAHKQQQVARQVLQGWPQRCGLFFPSHQMLQDFLEEGFLHGIERPVFAERPEMSHVELEALVLSFRRATAPGALLLGVLGGRLTEGIDYPGDTMERMLIFGIPYPKPTVRSQALIHYYDAKTSNGWQIAVHTPVGRVLQQAVGRLIRGPDDTGQVVVLDERAIRFPNFLHGLREINDNSPAAPKNGSNSYVLASDLDVSSGSTITK